MKIKLDENISRHLKSILNKKGHEVTTAEEQGLLGKADVEVGEQQKLKAEYFSRWTSNLQTSASSHLEATRV